MKVYIVSLAAGVLVGLIYALMQVRSPAPPAIALVGLLGMLIGEQAGPVIRKLVTREPITVGWLRTECVARITGVEARPAPLAKQDDRAA
ncbi:XapX domain-containing protein [Massilia suwonensis]|uniref:XapX domain-containing protein n=1 Tax=Massilia suwonensis TaxID=648895 RepID=A0ABW0MKK6_9BURK